VSLAEAERMIGCGEIAAALPVLTATVEREPRNGLAYFLMGRAALAVGEATQATSLFAIARQHGDPRLRARIDLFRGVWLREQGRPVEARAEFEKVLRARRAGNAATAVAAHALYELGQLDATDGDEESARRRLSEATRLCPDEPGPWLHLARIEARRGERDAALGSLGRALGNAGENAAVLGHVGVLMQELGDTAKAETAFRLGVRLEPASAAAHANLGISLSRQGRREEAAACFREALALDPVHPMAGHLLHALTGAAAPARASDAYVRELFDGFARNFDETLVGALQYRVPELIGAAVAEIATRRDAKLDILDAGCGTGLCGPLLAPHAARLAGVDLSPRMLEAARARGCYDELVEAEITQHLGARPAAFDLITAADVLVYFGELGAVFAAASAALRAGGDLVFTVERHEDAPGYRLNQHGRYSHDAGFVREAAAAAGLEVRVIEPITPRIDAGVAVDGYLVVLGKPSPG
jgi:predicted TPR repeat methyltransferase